MITLMNDDDDDVSVNSYQAQNMPRACAHWRGNIWKQRLGHRHDCDLQ